MLLIYTPLITNRLTYTFDLLLTQLLGLSYEFTTNRDEFVASEKFKFSYSNSVLSTELFFESSNLLFENDIHEITEQPIRAIVNDFALVGYFETKNSSTFSFDFFASAFLLVSRYEEYLPHQKDEHNRFHASKSLAFRDGYLNSPMVNYYAIAIKNKLYEIFPSLQFKQPAFEYISTIDVDMAYSFLHKGFKRNLGGFLKDFINAKYDSIKFRILVLMRKEKDPFDTFDYLQKVQDEYGIKNIFFFLLGDYGKHDKNTNFNVPSFRNLIQKISTKQETGIHYSYRSNQRENGYIKEATRLEEITGKQTNCNRFHFLKFDTSKTYNKIIKAEISSDFSMGYASQSGFRASLASPFYYFDLNINKQSKLLIHPFVYMDATFQYFQKLSIEQAEKEIADLMIKTQKVGGLFISIWHNNSLSEKAEWKGWRVLYEYTHELALTLNKK